MQPSILILGFGNPGRVDDGLGPALVEGIRVRNFENVSCETTYQLQVEDAAEVANHDLVVFADATTEQGQPFYFRPVEPDPDPSFSTHSVTPGAILALARQAFGATCNAWILGIRGHDFNRFHEGLSAESESDLQTALGFLAPWLLAQGLEPSEDSVDRTNTRALP